MCWRYIYIIIYASYDTFRANEWINKNTIYYNNYFTSDNNIYGLFLSFVGLKLARATNFKKGIIKDEFLTKKVKYEFNKKSFLISIDFGFLLAAMIVLSDKYIFIPNIPALPNEEFVFNPLYLISAIIYGGVVEEIMLRLFLMSLIVFILHKLFARKKEKTDIPSWIYVIALLLSAFLFGLGHLPAAFVQLEVTAFLICRIILLNSIGGIAFGYLYWKKGFEYGIIAHMFTHIFMQLLFFPLFF